MASLRDRLHRCRRAVPVGALGVRPLRVGRPDRARLGKRPLMSAKSTSTRPRQDAQHFPVLALFLFGHGKVSCPIASRQFGTGGRFGVVSCDGMELAVGSGYGMPTSSVPASAFSTACSATVVSPSDVAGSDGTLVSGGLARASALVMSPVTLRRHADRFGTSTWNSVSISRSVDVWSKTPETT